jgi:hypothetical protein
MENEIDLILNQPLEDLMSLYHELIDSFDYLEDSELFEAAKVLEVVEDYLIHLNVI